MYQRLLTKLNQLAVGLYKSVGSVLLGLILLGLLSYLGGQVFFLVSTRWAAPTVISPTDRRIVELSSQLAEQSVARDRIIAERRSVEAQLADAGRRIAAAGELEERYRAALTAEQEARGRERRRLTALLRSFDRAQAEVVASNEAFGQLTRDRAGALRQAQLIDREDYLAQNHAAAQLAQSNLALAQQEAELRTRADTLRRQLTGLTALVHGAPRPLLTPDLLAFEQLSTRGALELAAQRRTQKDLRAELVDLDADVARFNQLLEALRASPYLEAIHSPLTVAFVPYANLAHARPGDPVYGCSLLFLWCHQVGTVERIIPGEVQQEHPVRHLTLRGNMVTLALTDPAAAHDQILHLGRAPLWI